MDLGQEPASSGTACARQRLDRPYVRKTASWQAASWRSLPPRSRKGVEDEPERIGAIAATSRGRGIYALKLLMAALGSKNIDCRQDGAAWIPRSAAPATSSTRPSSIEQADAVLIIGANPRFEASVLNARIRKRLARRNLPVGLIGEVGDTRYDYELIGAGPES